MRFQRTQYFRLLVTLILLLLMGTFLEDSIIGRLLLSFILVSGIIVTVEDFTVNRRKIFFYRICIGLGFGLDVLQNFWLPQFSHLFLTARNLIFLGFLGMAMLAISKDVLKAKRVNNDLLLGGVCVYFLAAGLWAIAYQSIALLDPGAFYFVIPREGFHSYIYFSFTTLTTSGFGDILPVNRFAALLVNLEEIFGTMFPAIVIARLVSLYTIEEEERKKD